VEKLYHWVIRHGDFQLFSRGEVNFNEMCEAYSLIELDPNWKGLARLVEQYCRVKMSKEPELQLSRWSALRLTRRQINYACSDVIATFKLAEVEGMEEKEKKAREVAIMDKLRFELKHDMGSSARRKCLLELKIIKPRKIYKRRDKRHEEVERKEEIPPESEKTGQVTDSPSQEDTLDDKQ